MVWVTNRVSRFFYKTKYCLEHIDQFAKIKCSFIYCQRKDFLHNLFITTRHLSLELDLIFVLTWQWVCFKYIFTTNSRSWLNFSIVNINYRIYFKRKKMLCSDLEIALQKDFHTPHYALNKYMEKNNKSSTLL